MVKEADIAAVKIVDHILFQGSRLLLDIHLRTVANHVDHVVIVDSAADPLAGEELEDLKAIHASLSVHVVPAGEAAEEVLWRSVCASAKAGQPEDMLLIGGEGDIPSEGALLSLREGQAGIAAFDQSLHYGVFQAVALASPAGQELGSVALRASLLDGLGYEDLRNIQRQILRRHVSEHAGLPAVEIYNGGWRVRVRPEVQAPGAIPQMIADGIAPFNGKMYRWALLPEMSLLPACVLAAPERYTELFAGQLAKRDVASRQPGKAAVRARRLVLHIGLHKTGTSAIQRHLYMHRQPLLERGILYPKSIAWNDYSHHSPLFDVWDSKPIDAHFRRLKAEIVAHQPDTVIISSELIPTLVLDESKLLPFWSQLSNLADEVEVVAFVRRQDRLAESVFKQWVKSDAIRFCSDPLKLVEKSDTANLDFLSLIRAWAALEGVSKTSVVSYDHARKNLIERFMQAAGLSCPVVLDERDLTNVSLEGSGLRLKYFLNRFIDDAEQSRKILRAILGCDTIDKQEKLNIYTTAQRREIVEQYAADNRQLFQEFGNSQECFDTAIEDTPVSVLLPNGRELFTLLGCLGEQDMPLVWQLVNKMVKAVPVKVD